jgi:hypothetical protein
MSNFGSQYKLPWYFYFIRRDTTGNKELPDLPNLLIVAIG